MQPDEPTTPMTPNPVAPDPMTHPAGDMNPPAEGGVEPMNPGMDTPSELPIAENKPEDTNDNNGMAKEPADMPQAA